MSFPVSSEHAAAATVALVAPRTLRNSRRLTPALCVSWLMSVVAVGAVVACFLSLAAHSRRRRGGRCGRGGLLRGIARGLESFFRAVAVDVTAHAPSHVEARELGDAIHFLDLAVTGLTRHPGVHVSGVREMNVFGELVDSHPRDGLCLRAHTGAHAGDISILV